MAEKFKDRPGNVPPSGAFGGGRPTENKPPASPRPQVPAARPAEPRPPSDPKSSADKRLLSERLGASSRSVVERHALEPRPPHAAAPRDPHAPRPAARPLSPQYGNANLPSDTARTLPPARGPSEPRYPPATFSFPPASDSPPPGSEELVFEDLERTDPPAAGKSSLPLPLGPAEGHDAWTMDRMSRQSTVPPVRRDDVDRLRELSALPLGDMRSDAFGDALDLVDRSRPLLPPDLISEMEELYALDDLTGALRHAELILGRVPGHEQAERCAANCRARLVQLYSSKIGRLDRVVIQALGDSQVRWLGLDHRSGFLLSRVDGMSTVDELLDVCGMPRLEALKTLADLLDRGAIRLE